LANGCHIIAVAHVPNSGVVSPLFGDNPTVVSIVNLPVIAWDLGS
jgi:hypothetical protein